MRKAYERERERERKGRGERAKGLRRAPGRSVCARIAARDLRDESRRRSSRLYYFLPMTGEA